MLRQRPTHREPVSTPHPPAHTRAVRGAGSRTPVLALLPAALAALLLAGCATAPAASVPPAVVGPPAADAGAAGRTGAEPAAGLSGAGLSAADVDAWLDGLVPAQLESAGIAGGVVSVVADGRVLTSRAWGSSDLAGEPGEGPTSVDPDDTLFRVGSVSKVVTATAVMQLVERGELDLDSDVSEYLDVEIPRNFDAPLTLRHLLTHTAGFEERVRGILLPPGSEVDLREHLTDDPPPEQIYPPGTTPAYSNYGNALAGYVVERVSGRPFAEHVREEILQPAGMSSSGFEQPLPGALSGRVSQGYPDSSQPAVPFEVVGPVPAGALTSSATDMAQLMLAQLGGLPAERALLTPGSLEQMHAPALDAGTLGVFAEGPRMTLGLFDESRNGHRIVGHGGDTEVFHSHLQLYPDDGVGIFVSLNSSGPTGVETVDLRDAVLNGFSDRYFPRDPAAAVPAVESTAAEHAAMAEGTYSSSRTTATTFLDAFTLLSQVDVTARADGTVLITPGPDSVHPAAYEEVRPWVWREVDGERIITMQEQDGRVVAIGHGSAFTLLRVDTWRTATAALTVLGASTLVLTVSLLALPGGFLLRRLLPRLGAVASPSPRRGRTSRWLTRAACAATLLALVGWAGVVTVASGLQDVPDSAIRAVQLAQLLGAAGLVPAALALGGALRGRLGWWRVGRAALVLMSLGGVAWFAVTFRLLAPEVSY